MKIPDSSPGARPAAGGAASDAEAATSGPLAPGIHDRLVGYARRLLGGHLLDGRGPEEYVDLALEKVASGVRRVGSHSREQVLFGAVRSLVFHARQRAERWTSLESCEGSARAGAQSAIDPVVLRDALVKLAEQMDREGSSDGQRVLRCIIEEGGCGYLPPRHIATFLGWRRQRVYRAWQQVKARFIGIWEDEE